MKTLLAGALLLASCSSNLMQRTPASPLEVRYRAWTRGTGTGVTKTGPAVSTSVYRNVIAKSMYSQCRMVPHDSEYFDRLAKRCGSLRAVFRSAARLLLERAASTDYLVPVRLGGALHWLDPIGESPCD